MVDWTQVFVLTITLFFMLTGLVLTVVPPIPGTVIIWAAAVFYGLVLGWPRLGWLTFSLLTFLMLAGLVMDVLAGHFGARLGGASWAAVLLGAGLGLGLGIVASFIGSPVLGCLAGLVGMAVGIVLVEWRRHRNWPAVFRAIRGYLAGSLAGVAARLTSGVLMVAVFLARVYWGG